MYNNKKISVIIPVYNEEEKIGDIVRETKKVSIVDEILVIDDGSQDETLKVASEAGAFIISHPYNKGNGAAIKTGIRNAEGDILVLMDGDGQHNPQYIFRLVQDIGDYDMVVGARSKGSDSQHYRKIANMFYNSFASYLTGIKISDLTSGFRAIKRDIATRFIYLLPNTFSYPSTITLALAKAGYNLKYVPISTMKRVGRSKIRPLQDGIRFILIMLKIAMLFDPIKIFFPISAILMVLGCGYGLYKIIIRKSITTPISLLIIIGVLIFVLGLISEQIAQLRFERSERE